MSISVVNGFVCFNCTEIDKAKKGENPTGSPDALSGKSVENRRGVDPNDGSLPSSNSSRSDPARTQDSPPARPIRADGLGLLLDRSI